jgi:SPW repeat
LTSAIQAATGILRLKIGSGAHPYASAAARIDFWASSAVIAVVSAAASAAFSDWEEWLNLVLGIWLASAPWILGYAHTRAAHVSVAAGAIVAYLAAALKKAWPSSQHSLFLAAVHSIPLKLRRRLSLSVSRSIACVAGPIVR